MLVRYVSCRQQALAVFLLSSGAGAREYDQPKNYAILNYAYIVAI